MPPGATRWTLVVAVAVLGQALIGCGDDKTEAPSGPDPASVTPADALVYAEAVLRPEGEQREDVETALGTLLRTDDPGATIAAQLGTRSDDGGGAVRIAPVPSDGDGE
jgi:hypothetical protein